MENMDGIGLWNVSISCITIFLLSIGRSLYLLYWKRGLILSLFQCEFHATKSLSLGKKKQAFIFILAQTFYSHRQTEASLAMLPWDLLKKILDLMANLDLGTFPLTLIFFTKQHLEVQLQNSNEGKLASIIFLAPDTVMQVVYFSALWYNVGVLCLSYDSK